MSFHIVSVLKTVNGLLIVFQIEIAKTLIVPNFPILKTNSHGLIINFHCCTMLAEKIERASHGFQILNIVWGQASCRLKELERFVYFPLVTHYQGLHKDRIFTEPIVVMQFLFYQAQALPVVGMNISKMNLPVLPHVGTGCEGGRGAEWEWG